MRTHIKRTLHPDPQWARLDQYGNKNPLKRYDAIARQSREHSRALVNKKPRLIRSK